MQFKIIPNHQSNSLNYEFLDISSSYYEALLFRIVFALHYYKHPSVPCWDKEKREVSLDIKGLKKEMEELLNQHDFWRDIGDHLISHQPSKEGWWRRKATLEYFAKQLDTLQESN